MKLRYILLCLLWLLPCTMWREEGGVSQRPTASLVSEADACRSLYHDMGLEGVVNWKAFRQAVTGYQRIEGRKRDVLTLIDFSLPSTVERFLCSIWLGAVYFSLLL